MKRHPALKDFSRDHHQALIQAREINRVDTGHSHALLPEEVATNLIDFWNQEGDLHFKEEERLLLPRYSGREPQAAGHIERIRSDHAWLRAQMGELTSAHAAGRLNRLLLSEIGTRLHDHVRFEERVLFQRIQAILSEEELMELAEESAAFRKQHRGPGSIGPRRPT